MTHRLCVSLDSRLESNKEEEKSSHCVAGSVLSVHGLGFRGSTPSKEYTTGNPAPGPDVGGVNGTRITRT